jgi:TonB family protein
VFHALVLLAAVLIARHAPAPPAEVDPPERVTWVHVAPAAPVVKLEAVRSRPAVVEAPLATEVPEAPAGNGVRFNPTTIDPAKIQTQIAAGFKELSVPIERIGLPTPDSSAGAVSADDYRGRGVIGGAGNGRPNPIAPPGTLASGTGEGTGVSDTEPAQPRVYTAATVEVHPKLVNRDELAELLQRFYPPMMREAGIAGEVVVEFVITVTGDVDMRTFNVVSASMEPFREATRRAVAEFRWEPARRAGRRVPMLGRMTINWSVNAP